MRNAKALSIVSTLLFAAGCAYNEPQPGRSYPATGAYDGNGRVYAPPPRETYTPPQREIYAPPQRETVTTIEPSYAAETNLRVQGATEADDELGRHIVRQLQAEGALPPAGSALVMGVNHGHVHFKGRVPSSWEHRALVAVAARVPGVVQVQDEIVVR
jgi:hypothetical protein